MVEMKGGSGRWWYRTEDIMHNHEPFTIVFIVVVEKGRSEWVCVGGSGYMR